MKRFVESLMNRLFRSTRDSRRGTVLLLALGVLGILSIAAISYVTIVRIDRESAESGSRRASFQQQVDTVIGSIGSLIVADLYGNKIVDGRVPRSNWPAMFEDGDIRDIPSVDFSGNVGSSDYSFNPNDPGGSLPPNGHRSVLLFNDNAQFPDRRNVARPDDAWLASPEPAWETSVQATDTWPQITNLRSAYVWDSRDTDPNQHRWVRGDGRFVDLGQWFLRATDVSPGISFPNPGVGLMNWTDSVNGVTNDGKLGPDAGVNQRVFGYQMNTMSRYTAPFETNIPGSGIVDPFEPRDIRQWVDTDGDLRPDARWQQLDELGNLFGLNWVVAARIIDASSMVNLNSSIEFGPDNDVTGLKQADGRTPADIDLHRLLYSSTNSGVFRRPVNNDRFNDSYKNNLDSDLDVRGIFEDVKSINMPQFGTLDSMNEWFPGVRLSRDQREAFWRYFGSTPHKPTTTRGFAVPVRDLIDLAGFWGTNNVALVSRTEQRYDGPAVNGYLPNGLTGLPYGPMRSREQPEDIRRFADFPESANKQFPSPEHIKFSVRRHLTPVSGDAPFSPLPVLNTGVYSPYSGLNFRQKIALDQPLGADGIQRAFESFVWALAPLATNLPLSRDLADRTNFNLGLREVHYGNGQGGASQLFQDFQRYYPQINNGAAVAPTDASFAVVTAASLAANLADALDADGEPQVLRVLASKLVPSASPRQFSMREFNVPAKGVALGTSFAHGVIPPESVKVLGPGVDDSVDLVNQTYAGVTVVGLERQPFLTEVTTFIVYSDFRGDRSGDFEGGNSDAVIQNTYQEQLGSAIAVEIMNPWDQPIELGENYSIVIPEFEDNIDANPFVMTLPPFTIPPGARPVFYWILEQDGGRWDEVRLRMKQAGVLGGGSGAAGVEITANAISPPPTTAGLRCPFDHVLDGRRPALLVYGRKPTATGQFPGFVVDRMAPDANQEFPVGVGPGFDFGSTAVAPFADNFGAQFQFDNYYLPMGYLDLGVNRAAVDRREVTGRLLVTSTLARASDRAADLGTGSSKPFGGFPSTILEAPNANHVHTRKEAHAWINNPSLFDGLNIEPPTPALVPDSIISGFLPLSDVNFPDDHTDIPNQLKRADDSATNPGKTDPADFAGYQLYVPNPGLPSGPRLNAVSELLMLNCFAHTCRSLSPVAWQDSLLDLRNWQTVGEKMALSIRRDFQDFAMNPPSAGAPLAWMGTNSVNPYLCTLDPTRYIINDGFMGGASGLPDTMNIPLALRVLECFWPMTTPEMLAQGRININTAPAEVLEVLPMVVPLFDVTSNSPTNSRLPAGNQRLQDLLEYRDLGTQRDFIDNIVRIPGLRLDNTAATPPAGGFISTGELAILDAWDPVNPGNPAPGANAWLQFADPDSSSGVPSVPRENDGAPFEMVTGYAQPEFNPVDDAEERLALYRAVSNIVTTRSDVYIAWFVLRGYDPAVMERISIMGASNNAKLDKMNDETFKPAYESRWLVVFDRSKVTRPTDRPEILLKVELPRATP